MSTPNQRVMEYRKNQGQSQQQFAELMGVSRSYLGDIEIGRSDPSANFLVSLLQMTDVSADWILTGEGSMYRGSKSPGLYGDSEESETIELIIMWLRTWWRGLDNEHRNWLKVQIGRCFPEYAEWTETQTVR